MHGRQLPDTGRILARLVKWSSPSKPSHAQNSFLCCLSAQTGRSSEANHHSALLPCCHQLSLFLGNITLCCVTMATVGHHFEECNRETGGKGKEQSRAEPLLGTRNFWGGRWASSHFMEGETEERTNSLLITVNGGAECKTWHPHPTPGAVLLVDRKVTEPLQEASSLRETNKQRRGWGGSGIT